MVHAALTSALQGRSRRLLSYQVSRRPRRASISTGSPKRCSACGRAGAPVGRAERGSGPSWGRRATQARPYAFPARPHLHGATRPSCCPPQSGPRCRFPAASAPGRPPLAGGSWLGAAGHTRAFPGKMFPFHSLPAPRPVASRGQIRAGGADPPSTLEPIAARCEGGAFAPPFG